jgi:hypothetical protein
MSALGRLAALLGTTREIGAKSLVQDGTIDAVLASMRKRATGHRTTTEIPEDQQLLALRQFWKTQDVSAFRDAYLVSWGLHIAHEKNGMCLLEDGPRLERLLSCVDGWGKKPAAYRRCYQGLVKSYFCYVPTSDTGKQNARANWPMFREYLFERNPGISDDRANPEWVTTAMENRQLFGRDPCAPYVETLLNGDTNVIDSLCEQLSISKSSWFLEKLVMAQVHKAVEKKDEEFKDLLRRLLQVLANNPVLRDTGLRHLLDRYARVPGLNLHQDLRELTINWWGNPWLPSNETRWGGVTPQAKAMVSNWLKLEFIEDFFTKLAEDGLGDPRRMDFWKRYVHAIEHIEFALGSSARNSREPDFVALRKKMKGLICELDAPGTNNAFIMRMGRLVAVEFSDPGNALYGYDSSKSIPFDTSRTLRLPVDVNNSLKQKSKSVLWQKHSGTSDSWNKWETLVEEKLRREFGIAPALFRHTSFEPTLNSTPQQNLRSTRAPHSVRTQPYSRQALAEFVKDNGLQVNDKSGVGGNIWVFGGIANAEVSNTLTAWGFSHKSGKGWWK